MCDVCADSNDLNGQSSSKQNVSQFVLMWYMSAVERFNLLALTAVKSTHLLLIHRTIANDECLYKNFYSQTVETNF